MFLGGIGRNQRREMDLLHSHPLREKCPNAEFFLVRVSPHADCPNADAGKCGPEKTPYLDTFHGVIVCVIDSFITLFNGWLHPFYIRTNFIRTTRLKLVKK